MSCEFGVGTTHPGLAGPGISFSAAIGTAITPTPARAVRVCRNATCAVIPLENAPGPIEAAARTLTFTFGDPPADRITLSLTHPSGAAVVGVTWMWDGSSIGWKNGDLYTFEVLDGEGAVLVRQQKTGAYEPYTVQVDPCYGGAPLQCLRVTPTDVPVPPDAGSGGGPIRTDAGATPACCPRAAEPPPALDAFSHADCVALGGADRGGCFETCFRLCGVEYVSAVDGSGCEVWAPAPGDAGTPLYCGG